MEKIKISKLSIMFLQSYHCHYFCVIGMRNRKYVSNYHVSRLKKSNLLVRFILDKNDRNEVYLKCNTFI